MDVKDMHLKSAACGVAAAGVAGAVVAGACAAARELRAGVDKKEYRHAGVRVAKESLGGGLAAAAGVAVARTLFRATPLAFLGMVAVTVGAKYVYDELTVGKKAAALGGAEEVEAVACAESAAPVSKKTSKQTSSETK